MGLLDGKVVAITGAGAGIGREEALLAAKEGAKVIVNDLGGSRDGSGASAKVADVVVEEIKKMGGDAVGHYTDISTADGGNTLIKAGVDKWGRFDALVNNAGILRDKMSFNMTDDEWDLVIKVHMRGHFMCARAALQYFRQASKENKLPNGGAIVNTTSTSGLLGNAGQANYGAAKLGIVGMTSTLALEFVKYNIRINSIAPMALTRLTEDLPIAGMMKQLTPAHIAALPVFLCSDAAKGITGQVFGVFGKYVQVWRLPRPVHYWEAAGDMWDPKDLAKHADEMRTVIGKVNAPYMPGSPGPKVQ
ncbi:MAG TPA: SDR family NAD(P)-dependent oxidoreductase [bacterium]|nr:SDR family NAD(P)-dependent oxidoreductase [bacterium]